MGAENGPLDYIKMIEDVIGFSRGYHVGYWRQERSQPFSFIASAREKMWNFSDLNATMQQIGLPITSRPSIESILTIQEVF